MYAQFTISKKIKTVVFRNVSQDAALQHLQHWKNVSPLVKVNISLQLDSQQKVGKSPVKFLKKFSFKTSKFKDNWAEFYRIFISYH